MNLTALSNASSVQYHITSFSESLPITFPWYHIHHESVFPGISDKFASLLANVLIYWIVASIYHALDISGWKWLEKYRIQEAEEAKGKNLVTLGQAIRSVAFQQILQTTFGYIWLATMEQGEGFIDYAQELRVVAQKISRIVFAVAGEQRGSAFLAQHGSILVHNVYWWAIPILQFFFGSLIFDTYGYFLHRMLHEVKFLYKHVHSMHHRLRVPFAYGALSGHPLEGSILDSLGATLAHTLTGMSDRQAILFFVFVTYKNVDDHCGYDFPWHPIHILFANNSEYHDIHHQPAGLKSNFSQPLFIHWDVILGTRMTMEQLRAKKDGPKQMKLKRL